MSFPQTPDSELKIHNSEFPKKMGEPHESGSSPIRCYAMTSPLTSWQSESPAHQAAPRLDVRLIRRPRGAESENRRSATRAGSPTVPTACRAAARSTTRSLPPDDTVRPHRHG